MQKIWTLFYYKLKKCLCIREKKNEKVVLLLLRSQISYLRANIEFRNKACTRGKYYSYTEVIFVLSIFIYVYRHIYVRHVLAVALASLP